VQIGSVLADERGRSELKKEFDGAFGGKLYFDEVGVVVLVVSKDAGDDTPLVGFANDDFASAYSWRNFADAAKEQHGSASVPKAEQQEEPPAIEQHIVEQSTEELSIEEFSIEEVEEIEEPEESETLQECETAELVDTPQEPELDCESAESGDAVKAAEVDEEAQDAGISSIEPEIELEIEMMGSENLSSESEIDRIFSSNVQLRPFARQYAPVKWVRVSLRELVVLPTEFLRIMNNPLVVLCNEKYGHLIFGRDEGNPLQLFIGVPALYDNGLVPKAQLMGFSRFECCEDKEPDAGDHGYWILELTIS